MFTNYGDDLTPCPYCGNPTPGDTYCSVSCMKKEKAKAEQNVDEKQEIQQLYELLSKLTTEFIFCAFHKQKLADGKPSPIENELKDKYQLEKKKFCPRCYRTYGFSYLPKDPVGEEESWDFKLLTFEDMKELLIDLNHYVDKKQIDNLNAPRQAPLRPGSRIGTRPHGMQSYKKKKRYKRRRPYRQEKR